MSIPVVYVGAFETPEDWVDAAVLVSSPRSDKLVIVAPEAVHSALRELSGIAFKELEIWERIPQRLSSLNADWIVTGYADAWPEGTAGAKEWMREYSRNFFVVGGRANSLDSSHFPIDPTLRDAYPQRFAGEEDPAWDHPGFWNAILASGEGIIWLPRDLCIWRFDAVGMLSGNPNPLAQWLLGRYVASGADTEGRMLLSAIPAILLSETPEPMLWLRMFRTETVRIERDSAGKRRMDRNAPSPNAHCVVAVDGVALNRFLVHRIRSSGAGCSQ